MNIDCDFNCKECPELGMRFADSDHAIYWMYECNHYDVNAESLPEMKQNVLNEMEEA